MNVNRRKKLALCAAIVLLLLHYSSGFLPLHSQRRAMPTGTKTGGSCASGAVSGGSSTPNRLEAAAKLGRTVRHRQHVQFPVLHMKSDDAEANHKEVRNESIKLIRSTESSDSENTSSKSKSVWESQAVWRGVVVVLCILWASNYPVIKLLYDEVPSLDPQLFLAVRFSVASLFFIPSIVRSFKNTSFLLAATLMCVFIVPGHFGQAQGLVVSSADKGAFINSLGVVWVAFLDAIITRRIKLQTWIAGLMAVIGTALLELQGSSPPGLGDLWYFLQPIGFGTGFVLLEKLMVKYPNEADAATGLKMFSMAVFGTAWATINGHTPADIMPIITNTPALLNMLYVSAITTAGAIFVQSFAFRKVPATDVAMILTTEPVFAALIAAVLLGEMVNTRDIVGGGLIISACLINELNLVDKYFSSSNSGDDSSASKAAPDTNR